MNSRTDQKLRSRDKILEAAGRRLRAEGLDGATIATVMADAELTHGAFYAHFAGKDELMREALVHALDENRRIWIGQPQPESWGQRLARLARRYLTPVHRRDLSESCALSALNSEAARTDNAFRQTYEQELLKSLSAVCEVNFEEADPAQADDALAFMSLIIGSLALSRAVESRALSDRFLEAGNKAAGRLASYQE